MPHSIEPDLINLADRIPGMVYCCLADKKRTITFVSRGCYSLTGYLPEEMTDNGNICLASLVHPDDFTLVEEKISNCILQKRQQEITYRIITRSGDIRWVWEHLVVMLSESGNPISFEGYITDVTERKHAQDAVREQLLFEQLISDLSANLIHLSSDTVDARIEKELKHIAEYLRADKTILLYISEHEEEIHLIRRWTSKGMEPLPYKTINESLPWTAEQLGKGEIIAFSNLDELPEAGKNDRQTFMEMGYRSLLVIPLITGRSIIGAVGFASISSARKWPDKMIKRLRITGEIFANFLVHSRAEEEIREREELYRILTENIADGVMLIQEGRIIFFNSACRTIFDIPGSFSVHGKRVLEIICVEDSSSFYSSIDKLETCTGKKNTFRGLCQTLNNRKIWIEICSNLIKKGRKKAVLLTIRDITEDKTKEIALEEEASSLRRENIQLRSISKYRYRFGKIIGKSLAMQNVYELISQAASTNANVIIYGESGTGKELTARAIHELSSRCHGEIVTVNCGAIPENLLESEFFGYKKGAFTGAGADKLGYLDIADGGTLFLDEIGEISLNMQVKLLRVIEGNGYIPVGGTDIKTPDIRFIAATNRNLADLVSKGLMREDFYYRIHIIPITMPPLRDRKEDLPLLIDHFLKAFNALEKRGEISGEVMAALFNYNWPGNVRELQNLIHRMVTLGRIELSGIPGSAPCLRSIPKADAAEILPLKSAVGDFEKCYIREVLERNRWHKGKASAALGINRKTLFKKLKRYGLLAP